MSDKSPHRLATYYNPQATSPLYHFFYGARFFFSGWSLLFRNPPLLGLSLVPILLTLVLLTLLAGGSAWLVGSMFSSDSPVFGASLKLLAQVAALLLVLFVGVLLYLPLARVLLAPFAEKLSRRAYAIAFGSELPLSGLSVWRSMWEGAKLVSFQFVIALFALLLSLVLPIIGPIVGVLLGSLFCSLDFLDVSLSARGLPLKKKLAVWWRHKSLAFGFGTVAYFFLLIPVINLFALPVGVVGATILSHRLDLTDR